MIPNILPIISIIFFKTALQSYNLGTIQLSKSHLIRALLQFTLIFSFLLSNTLASDLNSRNSIIGPNNTQVLINRSVRLSCRLKIRDRFDQIQVQWLKDGFGYDNEALKSYFKGRYRIPRKGKGGNYDLVIDSLTEEDDGEYACQVSAVIRGRVTKSWLNTSKTINLTIIVPPSQITLKQFMVQSNSTSHYNWLKNKENVWGRVDDYVQLECEVPKSRPAAKIQWKLGKYDLDPGDSGKYGSLYTTTKYLDPAEEFYNQTVSKLKLLLLKDHNDQILRCCISNHDEFFNRGPSFRIIKLNVIYVSDVQIYLKPKKDHSVYTEHDVITLTCEATVNPASVIYLWTKFDPQTNEVSIFEQPTNKNSIRVKVQRDFNDKLLRCYVIAFIQSKKKKFKLTNKHKLLKIDQGYKNIEDIIKNLTNDHNQFKQYKYDFSQVSVRVKYGPVLLGSSLHTKAAFLGDKVTLKCEADSNPPSRISWYKSQLSSQELLHNQATSPVSQSDPNELVRVKRLAPLPGPTNSVAHVGGYSSMKMVSTSVTFTFTITNLQQFGLYMCMARATGFSPVQKSVFVGQGAPPKIYNYHTKFKATSGSSIRIPCKIISVPLPTPDDVLWSKYKEGTTDEFHDIVPNKEKYQIYSEKRLAGLVSYLYIHKVTSDDYGIFNCSARNLYGHQSSSFQIEAPNKPPIIFIVGSSCAILLALVFAFIVFCIVRSSRFSANNTARNRQSYTKGNFLDHNNIAHLDPDSFSYTVPLSNSTMPHHTTHLISNLHHTNTVFSGHISPVNSTTVINNNDVAFFTPTRLIGNTTYNNNNTNINDNNIDFIPLYNTKQGKSTAAPGSPTLHMLHNQAVMTAINPTQHHNPTAAMFNINNFSKAQLDDVKSTEIGIISGEDDTNARNTCWIHPAVLSDWRENPATPPGCTNGSSRSYDSGVGPDESNLANSSPKLQHCRTTNALLTKQLATNYTNLSNFPHKHHTNNNNNTVSQEPVIIEDIYLNQSNQSTSSSSPLLLANEKLTNHKLPDVAESTTCTNQIEMEFPGNNIVFLSYSPSHVMSNNEQQKLTSKTNMDIRNIDSKNNNENNIDFDSKTTAL